MTVSVAMVVMLCQLGLDPCSLHGPSQTHTVKKQSTENVQAKPNTSHDKHQFRIIHIFINVSS